MAPAAAAANGLLRQAVHYHLDNSSYENALFFAERLCAQDKTVEAAYMLALCHLRLGDDRSAYEVSKAAGYRGTHLGCSYVFAQASLRLERYKDGITALEKSKGSWLNKNYMGKHNACSRMPHPDAAACSCLLGKLYRAYDDKTKAVACFEDALKTNPFMWDAFTALSDMGANVRIPNIFKPNEQLLRNLDQEQSVAAGPKETGHTNPLEPLSKRSTVRTATQEAADPFETQRSTAFQDIPSFSNLQSAEVEGNDLLSKIAAARSRNAAGGGAGHGQEGMETPTGPSTSSESLVPRPGPGVEPPQAPMRKSRTVQPVDTGLFEAPKLGYRLGPRRKEKGQEPSGDVASEPASSLLRSSALSGERKRTVSGHVVQPRQIHPEDPGAPPRRSTRLNFINKATGIKANSGAATIGASANRELKKTRAPVSRLIRPGSSGTNVGRVVSGNRTRHEENGMDIDHAEAPTVKEAPIQRLAPKPVEPEVIKAEETLKSILELLKRFATGYSQLAQFHCQDALATYACLPRWHQDTPWVLAQMGRAHYELASYAEAEKYFRRLRILAPTRLEDMEVYSTILWFLKRETDLSFLAHDLVDSAWHSPQAWCALGNAWSLALDHEQALRCFKRATQLDSKFAYAFTLQGHEHVLNEEYDKALTAYRQAIAADRRHYNAYYGIGKVYEKLGNYDKAYTHYHSASVIHPTNAVLICCIGTVLEKQKQIVQALQYFSKATDLAPRAAQTRFKKARALLAIGQLQAAQKELIILKDLAPDEARVHFLLGKLYKTLNDKSQAVRHFTQALSLDPKASQQIKEAIESLEEDDGFDDSMIQ